MILDAMETLVNQLRHICGNKYILLQQQFATATSFVIEAKPGTAEEVSEIMKCCHARNLPVVIVGGGTGLVAAKKQYSHVALSLARLNKIISWNAFDRTVVVEGGVITAELEAFLVEKNMRFPIVAGSSGSCFIGGNIATNAGAPSSAKYGSIRNYVLNLEVVLANGEKMWTAANTTKNASGYPLTQLFTGSEGTLGVITKAVLKTLPAPKAEAVLLAPFKNISSFFEAFEKIVCAGFSPVYLEYIGQAALQLTTLAANESFPFTEPDIKAHMLIGMEATSEEELVMEMAALEKMLNSFTAADSLVGIDTFTRNRLCMLRNSIGPALESIGYRDIDACVPRSCLQNYLVETERICNAHQQPVVIFGHAMDGNLHVMLLKSNDATTAGKWESCTNEIFKLAKELGGVISGEHGIGMLQKKYFKAHFTHQYAIMKNIKNAFDPLHILNRDFII